MSNQSIDNDPAPSFSFTTGKFLTFQLADEAYGVEVLKIREIIRIQKITPVPQMPSYVKGVINLRGKVIPIIDLRLKFDLSAPDTTERSCVIVVDIEVDQGMSSLIGLVVDSVEEVINITESDVEPSPDFGTSLSNQCCLGIAKVKEKIMTLLDIEKVVSRELAMSDVTG